MGPLWSLPMWLLIYRFLVLFFFHLFGVVSKYPWLKCHYSSVIFPHIWKSLVSTDKLGPVEEWEILSKVYALYTLGPWAWGCTRGPFVKKSSVIHRWLWGWGQKSEHGDRKMALSVAIREPIFSIWVALAQPVQ